MVGRDPAAAIAIDHPQVSWRHAVLHYEHGRWTLNDLASTNGTFSGTSRRETIDLLPGTNQVRLGPLWSSPLLIVEVEHDPATVTQTVGLPGAPPPSELPIEEDAAPLLPVESPQTRSPQTGSPPTGSPQTGSPPAQFPEPAPTAPPPVLGQPDTPSFGSPPPSPAQPANTPSILEPQPSTGAPGVPQSPVDQPNRPERSEVSLGVSAPTSVAPSQHFVARLVAYEPGEADEARRLLAGPRRKAKPSLGVARCRWAPGTTVDVALSGPGLAPQHERGVWNGGVLEFSFDVSVEHAGPETVLTFEVSANGIPVAKPRLEVRVRPARALSKMGRPKRQSTTTSVPTTAFASYASSDRGQVLAGVGALESIGLDVFTDCLDLKPGEQYKTRLLNEILARDLFVLFWSENARQSKWVEWEYVTVLDFKGEEPVRINPLQPEVPPPTRLSHLHFGSRAAWYSAASSG